MAVLMGGDSAEREVSLMSGREVAGALRQAGFRVDAVDLKPAQVDALAGRDFDVAFIALHGAFGEDGQLQRRLDELGLLYVGSGPDASRNSMDKVAAKNAFSAAGIPTPPWRVVAFGDEDAARAAYRDLGPGVVVKPVDEGSSIGVTPADSPDAFREGLAAVFSTRREALIEQRWVGRELTVGVLHDEGLPVVEIVPGHTFYDYEAKYFDDATQYVTDPALPEGVESRVRSLAVAAHRALGCRDFSRVDFMLDGAGRPSALEVNTIPGFTAHSLLPKSAAGAGIDFPLLCRTIVELALRRRSEGPGS